MNLDRFDRLVIGVIAGLVMLISGVVLAGNNVGVQVESVTPQDRASARTEISIRFFTAMSRPSVEERLRLVPPVEGTFRWNNVREVIFTPAEPLQAGETYTVTLESGAESADGNLALREDVRFTFQVDLPRLIFLAPSDDPRRNLYAFDLNTNEATPLTDSEYGIVDYAVSPNADYIAYTQYNAEGNTDIWLLDVGSGQSRRLTDCQNAICQSPSWSPQESVIAYERNEYDPALGFQGAVRVWKVDIETAQSTLMFADTQIVGHSPLYAPDNQRLAMVSTSPPGILVYDFKEEQNLLVPTMQGIVGSFSPDGSRLVYPTIVAGASVGQTFYTHLEMVDISDGLESDEVVTSYISGPPETAVEDTSASWHPDGVHLLIARRYLDERYTNGTQFYLMNTETGEVEPLVVDADYRHSASEWSSDGSLLVLHRFNLTTQNARPEIWLYNMETGDLIQVAANAFLPGFLE